MKLLVSACLLGVGCRYDGGHNQLPQLKELLKTHTCIPICPEQMGGLPTPDVYKRQAPTGEGDILAPPAVVAAVGGVVLGVAVGPAAHDGLRRVEEQGDVYKRQAQAAVELAAGVEELFQGQAAGLVPGLQLLQGGVVLFNVPNGVGELVLVQPLLGLFAGGAPGICLLYTSEL